MSTHPDIAASFRETTGGYTSRSGGGFISCPPYVIAMVAAWRVPPGSLSLPEGYDESTLDRIRWLTGYVDQDVHISGRQAAELADIGRQILALDGVELSYFERQSIERLVSLAGTTETTGGQQ